jgi:hypothetical protein
MGVNFISSLGLLNLFQGQISWLSALQHVSAAHIEEQWSRYYYLIGIQWMYLEER